MHCYLLHVFHTSRFYIVLSWKVDRTSKIDFQWLGQGIEYDHNGTRIKCNNCEYLLLTCFNHLNIVNSWKSMKIITCWYLAKSMKIITCLVSCKEWGQSETCYTLVIPMGFHCLCFSTHKVTIVDWSGPINWVVHWHQVLWLIIDNPILTKCFKIKKPWNFNLFIEGDIVTLSVIIFLISFIKCIKTDVISYACLLITSISLV